MCIKDAAKKNKKCLFNILHPVRAWRHNLCVDLLRRLNVTGHDGRLSHSLVSCVEPRRRVKRKTPLFSFHGWRAEFPVRLIARLEPARKRSLTRRLAKRNMWTECWGHFLTSFHSVGSFKWVCFVFTKICKLLFFVMKKGWMEDRFQKAKWKAIWHTECAAAAPFVMKCWNRFYCFRLD